MQFEKKKIGILLIKTHLVTRQNVIGNFLKAIKLYFEYFMVN